MEYRRYLVILGLLIAIGLSALALSWAFLWRAGELETATAIAKLQAGPSTELRYGTALNQNTPAYKLALAEARRPEVLIAGSSRVMQFRSWNFEESSMTGGGAGSTIDELHEFLEGATRAYKPRLVVIGIDFWWFHPGYRTRPAPPLTGAEVTKDKLLWLGTGLRKKRIRIRELVPILSEGYGNRPGLSALLHDEGFRSDGSWRYNLAWRMEPGSPNDDRSFHRTLAQIDRGESHFSHGTTVDTARLRRMGALLAMLRNRGIHVQLFLPPFAGPVWKELNHRREQYRYFDEVRAAMSRWPVPVLDLSDPVSVRAADCEFIDGFHGGDIVYARIAQKLAANSGQLLHTTALNDRHALLLQRPSAEELPLCPAAPEGPESSR